MMTTEENAQSIQKTARIAGFFYLILAICGGFAEFAVRQGMIVPGDAAATVNNILASESTFRLGVLSELIGQTVFIFLVLYLFRLLQSVNRNQAVLMVVLVIVAVTITSLNMLNQLAVLLLIDGSSYLAVFEAGQQQALVLFFLNLHRAGYLIAQIFFGLWLFPLGYLIYRSGFMPKIVGILLMVTCLGYLTDVVTYLMIPGFPVTVSEFTFIGELVLLLWLLIKGVNVKKWEERARQAALA